MTQEAIEISTTPPLPGLKLVQDVNKALQTIATDFAGPTDPAGLPGCVAYCTWADTGNMLLKRRNAANTAWITIDYLTMSLEDRHWAYLPVGLSVFIPDYMAGAPIPPTGNPHFRYIKLTAGDSYNSGALTSESVSGSFPLVIATAVINMPDSPFYGQTVNLLNTEGRIERPGGGGVLQSHSTEQLFAKIYTASNLVQKRVDTPPWSSDGHVAIASTDSSLTYTRGTEVAPLGAGETAMKSISVPLYMRIK